MKRLILFVAATVCSMNVYAQDPVDYDTDIAPIMQNRCNNCHNAGQNAFNSSSYAAVMASVSPPTRYDKNQVIPGDPDGSPLVDKIEPNPQFGTRMPQGSSLSDDQIALIRRWIAEGANEVATSNENGITDVPDGFKLQGNYPNPFNPTTLVVFDSQTAGEYRLSIFNVAGVKVGEYSGRAATGSTNIAVQMNDQPTGVYFYRLNLITAGNRSVTADGKMTLIR
ncbi:T9SS type A sorting domain-containing protein [Balneola sp. MJW-20]|uniref:T9SS type A sorting domain-containing protein n=1 Tax=Gracilimonas aurantiaca TaxID=3234185 RepID=UPI00346745F0